MVYIHLSRSLYLNFNYLVSVTAGGPVSPPRAHVAKFYGWLRLIRSVWRTSKFSFFKIDRNFNFVGLYYTIPFCFNLLWHLLVITFQLFKLHCLVKDHWRGFSTRNAHMVYIVNLIRLKWCIHLSRSRYFNFNYLVSVNAGGPLSPRGHM